MKRVYMVGLVLAFVLVGLVPAFGQSALQNSGMKVGQVNAAGELWGNFPYEGVLLRVTSVTSTTVFYCEQVKGVGGGVAGGGLIANFPVNAYSLLGVQTSDTLNDFAARSISAFDAPTGKFTVQVAWAGLLVKNDLIALAPKSIINQPRVLTSTARRWATLKRSGFAQDAAFGDSIGYLIPIFTGAGTMRLEWLMGTATVACGGTTNGSIWITKTPRANLSITNVAAAVALSTSAIGSMFYVQVDSLKALEIKTANTPFYPLNSGVVWDGKAHAQQPLIIPDMTWAICDSTNDIDSGKVSWSIKVIPLGDNWQIRRATGN